ncbi:MAG: phage replisome organizer N-terminal domain-containing protein [Parabacteroides sp.]|nr:phage replisome organizer N-terminal domain-containing protein [Parabacteroides sp.]
MSESEKKRFHFIQFSSDFLINPKIQKLYMATSDGKGLVMIYLQLLLLAAKNGNVIKLDDMVYESLGEQLSPQILCTTPEDINIVIEHFIKCGAIEKHDNSFEFLHSIEFTQSITRGAINKRNQRIAKKADIVGSLSATQPTQLENVGNNNNNNNHNDIYINNNIILLNKFGVTQNVIHELLATYPCQQISNGIIYAMNHINNDIRNPAGYVVQCVRNNYLSSTNSNKDSPKATEPITIEMASDNVEPEPYYPFDDALEFWNNLSSEQKKEFWCNLNLNKDISSTVLQAAYQKHADNIADYNLTERLSFAKTIHTIKEEHYGNQC